VFWLIDLFRLTSSYSFFKFAIFINLQLPHSLGISPLFP